MSAASTLAYIQASIRLKVSKKIIETICSKHLKIKNSGGDNISLTVCLNTLDSHQLDQTYQDIPEEGGILLPHIDKNFNKTKDFELIDILIVDDIEFNLIILKKLLESLEYNCKCTGIHRKYTIHSANSGPEAIKMILKQSDLKSGYKVVIMDCLMPEMDGWEASKVIHTMFKHKKITTMPYIIAYSAFDSKEDIRKCNEAGMCSHISKPCYKEELCSTINNWISRSPTTSN
jgi:CheY-like chemotaxis protein